MSCDYAPIAAASPHSHSASSDRAPAAPSAARALRAGARGSQRGQPARFELRGSRGGACATITERCASRTRREHGAKRDADAERHQVSSTAASSVSLADFGSATDALGDAIGSHESTGNRPTSRRFARRAAPRGHPAKSCVDHTTQRRERSLAAFAHAWSLLARRVLPTPGCEPARAVLSPARLAAHRQAHWPRGQALVLCDARSRAPDAAYYEVSADEAATASARLETMGLVRGREIVPFGALFVGGQARKGEASGPEWLMSSGL